jgi:OFA family oxalate/formate antiporter-like MFS transporter
MPAFAADLFGSKDVGSIYGLMLTAWGFAGVAGPALIASIRERTGHYEGALHLMAGVMLVSAILPFLVRPPRDPKQKPHPLFPSHPTPRVA